jgi:hypothetical protein
MAKLLGTPYERGKSDAFVSRKPTGGTPIEEGLFVKQGVEGFVSLTTATAPAAAWGVMGQQESIACGVVISGLKVAVQLTDGITPAAGETVFVNDLNNKATNILDTDNFATAATFTGVIGNDGRSDNTSTKSTNKRWAEINMPNGL